MTTKSCLRRLGATAVTLLAVIFMIGLTGCDGRSGSSGTLPLAEGETALNETAATTVTTKLSLALTSAAKTAMPKAAVMAYEAAATSVQSATVSLTLPDGRVIAMTYAGNGEYKCSIAGLPSGSAGYIEAKVGGVVVKNFFDGIEARNGSLNAGLTNPDSTLVTDLLMAFAETMDPDDPDYTVNDLLANIGSAKLNIDVTSLKDQVADGEITGYELARQTYNNVLTWGNSGLSESDVHNMLFGAPEVSNLFNQVSAGGYAAPTTGTDEDEIKQFAADFIDAYMNKRTVQDISPFYSDTNFLWHGNNKPEQMLEDAADWAVSPKFKNLTAVSLANLKYAVAAADDFTQTGLTMYQLSVGGTMDLTYAGNVLVTRRFGPPDQTLLVAKVNSKWVLFGDQKRMWFDYSVGYFSTPSSASYTELAFDTGNGQTYVPTSVKASCPDLFGAADPVTLLSGGGVSDPDEYLFTLTAGTGSEWIFDNEGNNFNTGVAYLGLDAKVVSVITSFGDGKQETYDRLVKIKEPTTTITEFTINGNGSIKVSWRPPLIEKQLLRVELRLVGKNLFYTFPPDTYTYTIPAADLATAGLLSGDAGILDVVYFTEDKEFAFRQDFYYSLKAVPNVVWPVAGAITYGETLAASSLTGGSADYNSASVPGAFAFANTTLTPNAGTANQTVVFTPTDGVNFETVTGSVSVTVNKAAQTITGFAMNPTTLYVGETATLSASGGGSGNQLVYSSTTPGICTVSGTSITGVGVGICTIEVNQAGNSNYDPATALTQNVTVGMGTPNVTVWPSAGTIIYGQTLASSILSGGTVSVPGTFGFIYPATVPVVGTASQQVIFTPTDSANYNTVTGSVNVTVTKATPSVTTWPTASGITYGQTLASSVLGGGSASVPGTFAFTSPSTAPNAGTASQGVTFTPTDTTNYNTVSGTVSVTVAKATPVITTLPTATNITYGQTLAQSVLNGAASVPGAFAFNSPSTAPAVGTASQAVTFFPTDMTNYNTVGTWADVTVIKATPKITTMPVVSGMIYGMTWRDASLTPGVAKNQAETVVVTGSFNFVDPGLTPDAGTQTVDILFTPDDTANWNAVTISMWATVDKATPSGGTWPTGSDITYGQTLADSVLSFISGDLYHNSSPVPGTFGFKYPSTVPNVGTDSYTAIFTPSDSANYNSVEGSIDVTVLGLSQTITGFNFTSASILLGDTATASATGGGSGNPVVFSSLTPGICTVSGTNGEKITGIALGTCTIAADQAGNSTYDAATQVTKDITVGMFSAGKLVRITGGEAHSIGIKDDGTVWTWGFNSSGRLGDGTFTDRHTPVQVPGLTGMIGAAGGNAHTLAVKYDGTVYAWGMNLYGQLGNGTNTDSWSPVQVSGLTGVIQVAAGDYHSVALKSDGTVWTWGYNTYGQLGDNTTANKNAPLMVPGITGAVRVGASGGHTLVAKSDGTVWAFGYNNHGQLGNNTTTNSPIPVQVIGLTGVTELDGGYYHSVALRNDGAVFAWGWGMYGEVGDGTGAQRPTPVQVTTITGAVSVAAGDYHSMAVLNDGTVKSWGLNQDGQLGDGTVNPAYSPVTVTGLTGMVQVGGGGKFSLALRNDGTVWTFGDNTWGQLGNNEVTDRLTPVSASGLNLGAEQLIAGGAYHSLTLRNDGTVWAWGRSNYGQIGDGTFTTRSTPVKTNTLTGIVMLSAGSEHSLALRNDGTVATWGRNNLGQLGDGTTTTRAVPQTITGLTGIVQANGAYGHNAAVKNDGTVWTWGQNSFGQLGDGTTNNSLIPHKVNGLNGVLMAGGGYEHTIALKADGTVWAWGSNINGYLGDGTSSDSYVPIKVAGLNGVTRIATGTYHTLALKSDGTVWAWGANGYGQLGNGSNTDSHTPAQVVGLTGIIKIAAGGYHSLALKNDGTVWAWGANGYGQLGNAGSSANTPVQVMGLSGIRSLAAGYWHSIALDNNGTVHSWGLNAYYELGDGTNTDRYTPVSVISIDALVKVPSYVYTWPAAGTLTYGQALSSSSLTGGSASQPGAFTYDNPTYVPNAGTASQAVTFTPTNSAAYSTVAGSVNVTVNQASQTITSYSITPPAIEVGQTATASALGGASANPVVFSSLTTNYCTVSGTYGQIITGVAAGTCTIAANQAGNTNYAAAAEVTKNITIDAPNTAPVANPKSLSTPVNEAVSFTITGYDAEVAELVYELGPAPANGVVSGTAPNLTYTPNTSYAGTDTFTFRVFDGELYSDWATVTIKVMTPPPSPLISPTDLSEFQVTTNVTISYNVGAAPGGDGLVYATRGLNDDVYTAEVDYTTPFTITSSQTVKARSYYNDGFGGRVYSAPTTATIYRVLTFADSNLENAVRVEAGIGDGGRLEYGVLTSLASLDASYWSIIDLTGLENLTGLRTLSLEGNTGILDYSTAPAQAAINVAVLQAMDLIESLDISITGTTDITFVTGMNGLTTFKANDNGISFLAPIAARTNLVWLELASNDINDITALGSLVNLKKLWLYLNPLASLTPLNTITGLELLELTASGIDDTRLAGLGGASGGANFPNLQVLGIGYNDISETGLNRIGTFTSLSELSIRGMYSTISDITPLSTLTGIMTLDISNNAISDLSPISGLTGTVDLNISDNQISDLSPISGLTGMIVLDISNNSISDISPLAALTGVEYLYMTNNQIAGIGPLAGMTGMLELDMSYNYIPNDATSQAVIPAMTGLTYLDVSYNYMYGDLSYMNFVSSVNGGWLDTVPQYPAKQ